MTATCKYSAIRSVVHGFPCAKPYKAALVTAGFQDSREVGSTSRGLQRSGLWVPPVRVIVTLSPGTCMIVANRHVVVREVTGGLACMVRCSKAASCIEVQICVWDAW